MKVTLVYFLPGTGREAPQGKRGRQRRREKRGERREEKGGRKGGGKRGRGGKEGAMKSFGFPYSFLKI